MNLAQRFGDGSTAATRPSPSGTKETQLLIVDPALKRWAIVLKISE